MTKTPPPGSLQDKLQSMLQNLRAKGIGRTTILDTTRQLLRQKKDARAGGNAENIARSCTRPIARQDDRGTSAPKVPPDIS